MIAPHHPAAQVPVNRRAFFKTSALAGTAVTFANTGSSQTVPTTTVPPTNYKIVNGRIRQSVMAWCFNPMPMEELIAACHAMGMPAMEGIDRTHYPRMRELGMVPAIVGSHGFATGPINRDNHAECLTKLREAVDVAVKFGSKNVITFTGMREAGITDEAGARNCVDCWKEAVAYAGTKNVNLCLEHLNTRDDTHPMKGHPGYFGDDVDFCIELIKKVDSPNMKLLFDIYHVQVMNGDVTRRLRQYIDFIGHIHTAGVPGRAEIDETQEVNYPAIMRTILDLKYEGFVAQEFIPTWDDKLSALRHGVATCDV